MFTVSSTLVPEMTYYVSSGTLNPTHSIVSYSCLSQWCFCYAVEYCRPTYSVDRLRGIPAIVSVSFTDSGNFVIVRLRTLQQQHQSSDLQCTVVCKPRLLCNWSGLKELSTFRPMTFHSLEWNCQSSIELCVKITWNFRFLELLLPLTNFRSWERKVLGRAKSPDTWRLMGVDPPKSPMISPLITRLFLVAFISTITDSGYFHFSYLVLILLKLWT